MTGLDDSDTDLYLLVDGGGTKTRAAAVNVEGERLGEGLAGPSNLMLGAALAREAVDRACAAALAGLGDSGREPELYCAMAGGSNRRLCQEFSAMGRAPAALVTDGYAAMLGAHGSQPGVGIVVGTGTAGHCLTAEGTVRARGGWGLALGDEGSGAWIGRASLALTAKIIDRQADPGLEGLAREEALAFARARLAAAGVTRTALLEWVRAAEPSDYASLAPDIIAEAQAGNSVADRLLRRAGATLDDLRTCLDETGRLPVSLSGGLAEPMARFLPEAMAARLRPPKGDVIDGLWAIAMGRAPAEPETDKLLSAEDKPLLPPR